jgi:hypothetical protein
MAEFIDAAVALGWTLVGYEAQLDLAPPRIRDRPRTLEQTNLAREPTGPEPG